MKNIKKTIGIVVLVVSLAIGGVIFVQELIAKSSDSITFRLAHNMAKDSEVSDSVALISDFVEEDASMNMAIDIYPSGVLGSEKEIIEMVQAGVLDMAKISANTLGQFNDYYSTFALPYLFKSQEHYYNAMENSEKVQELYFTGEDKGYIAIGYYATGARNIYMKEDIVATDPSKLKGKKFRTMPNSVAMEMMELMGGSPVPMAASETYTAIQQGVIDGAENTELALNVDKHAEIAKAYTYTEHLYSPDIYIISTEAWNKLTEEQQQYLIDCFTKLNDNYKNIYNAMMDSAIEEAKEMGMNIYKDIDKTPFIEAVQPMHERFTEKGGFYQELYDDIQQYAP